MARKAGQGKEEEESRARQQGEDASLPWKRSPCSGTSLINKLKPGIIKKINRLSTPIAGL
ncbi:hypothetical protein STEG23_016945, partial [Scotinomys teguina]